MPKQVFDIKQFIEICRREDAKTARIKKSRANNAVKFKVRCKRYLYTLTVKDSEKAEKLRQSLPPSLEITEVDKKNKKAKKSS